MTLKLTDLFCGAADRWWCPPFDRAVASENERWWDKQRRCGDDPWYLQVLEGAVEVARVELDDPGGVNPEYVGVPELGQEMLEIKLVEVATAARGRGVGTGVVRALEEWHADRRLFAYREDAHGFWGSLGWDRFDHPLGELARPLFIHPVRE